MYPKQLLYVLAIVLMTGTCSPAGAQEPVDRIEQLLTEAETEINRTVWKSLGPATTALKLAREQGDTESIAKARLLLGKIYLDLKDTEKALTNLLEALDTFQQLGDKKSEAQARNRLGRLYRELNEDENALPQLEAALNLYREINDQHGISRALNSLGAYYWSNEAYNKALEHFLASVDQQEERKDPVGLSAAYNNIGIVYQELNDPDHALDYYNRALKIGREANYNAVIASAMTNRASLYANTGRLADAFKDAQEAESIASGIGALDQSLESLDLMADIRRRQGRFRESLSIRDQADQIRDTLAARKVMERIALIQASHDFKDKEQTIRLLEQENRIQDLTIEKQKINRNLMILGLLLLGGFSLGFLYLYLSRARQTRHIESSNRELKQALERITALTDLLTVCSSCRKVRDKNGNWLQLEGILPDYSLHRSTGELCPDCRDQSPELSDTKKS